MEEKMYTAICDLCTALGNDCCDCCDVNDDVEVGYYSTMKETTVKNISNYNLGRHLFDLIIYAMTGEVFNKHFATALDVFSVEPDDDPEETYENLQNFTTWLMTDIDLTTGEGWNPHSQKEISKAEKEQPLQIELTAAEYDLLKTNDKQDLPFNKFKVYQHLLDVPNSTWFKGLPEEARKMRIKDIVSLFEITKGIN